MGLTTSQGPSQELVVHIYSGYSTSLANFLSNTLTSVGDGQPFSVLPGTKLWLRIIFDATNVAGAVSFTGVRHYIGMGKSGTGGFVAKATAFTTAPDRAGFCLFDGTLDISAANIFHFQQS